MTHVFRSADDLTAAVGTHLGFSGWLTVDQQRIDTFADATGDHQWIHVDPERAAAGPFGTTIAHGFLTLSLVPYLLRGLVDYPAWPVRINYGSDRVRFLAPVPVGSRVRAGAELVAVRPSGTGTQVAVSVTVEIEGSDKPALVAQTLTLLA
jgi:acyl dehydratase